MRICQNKFRLKKRRHKYKDTHKTFFIFKNCCKININPNIIVEETLKFIKYIYMYYFSYFKFCEIYEYTFIPMVGY